MEIYLDKYLWHVVTNCVRWDKRKPLDCLSQIKHASQWLFKWPARGARRKDKPFFFLLFNYGKPHIWQNFLLYHFNDLFLFAQLLFFPGDAFVLFSSKNTESSNTFEVIKVIIHGFQDKGTNKLYIKKDG